MPTTMPTTFPCWTRALYSWSGETKGDLGFVEGDWIECLNAGDGNFWYGRLKRNHTAGCFPSNYVEVLQPARTPSPLQNAMDDLINSLNRLGTERPYSPVERPLEYAQKMETQIARIHMTSPDLSSVGSVFSAAETSSSATTVSKKSVLKKVMSTFKRETVDEVPVERSTTPNHLDMRRKAEQLRTRGTKLCFAVQIVNNMEEERVDYSTVNFSLIDKTSRSTVLTPAFSHRPAQFARKVLCRPYANDVQRLRAIFTWMTETKAIEACFDFSVPYTTDVFSAPRANAVEMAYIVQEMCESINVQCEVVVGSVRGVLHAWNAVFVREWRMIDTAQRPFEPFYFLTPPTNLIYSHHPLNPQHQYLPMELSAFVLDNLPHAFPAYFTNRLKLPDDFHLATHCTAAEPFCIDVCVPPEVECLAEVETSSFVCGPEGDMVESGTVSTPGLAQIIWVDDRRIARIKCFLPDSYGTLRIYAGCKRLLTASENPFKLALALPLEHGSPGYAFVQRIPNPQAQKYDIYIKQPQFLELRLASVYSFTMLQHHDRPAKLAIQSPGGKLHRSLHIKINEVGIWRGVIYNDRAAQWSAFAQWQALE